MSPRRRRALLIALAVLVLALIVAPAALAAAGGGSSGFGGGGGGDGGGSGKGFALYILIDLLVHIAVLGHGLGALVLIALALVWLFFRRVAPWMADRRNMHAAQHTPRSAGSSGRGRPSRERRVELAAAEASDEDPEWAADKLRTAASQLFADIQSAWDADDRTRLRGLVAPDLMTEWERRLDDFDRRGWRNRVHPLGDPVISLAGLTHTGDELTDRVVVGIDARLKDYVVDRYGRHLKRTGRLGETTRIREFWTLGRRQGRWMLVSIEQAGEGAHALDERIVATPWADERGMRDEALLEGAAADAVPDGTAIADVADVQYEGDAHAAAMDLSVADGRFAPDVLEVSARRAVEGWAQAVDGDDGALRAVATPQAVRDMLYAGDTSEHTRIVVRGPEIKRIRVVSLDAAASPATMILQVDLSGRRYLEDRDTAAVLAGSRTKATGFTERWTLSLTDDAQQPWRITAVGEPIGLR